MGLRHPLGKATRGRSDRDHGGAAEYQIDPPACAALFIVQSCRRPFQSASDAAEERTGETGSAGANAKQNTPNSANISLLKKA
jgi:hypothetical protein